MTPCLALDLSSIALAPFSNTPRGIDRVELAYARHFLNNWPDDCVAVLPMPWGVRCYKRDRALRFLRAIEDVWRETIDPSKDNVYSRTKQFLSGVEFIDQTRQRKEMALKIGHIAKKYWTVIADTRFSFGWSVSRELPNKTIYLNVGQLEVFRPFFWWLHHRPDVVSVFMIHDVIPIELPEYHVPLGIRLHHSIVRNVAEFANALIVPSHAARISIQHEMSKYRRVEIPTHVELLPVPSEFLVPATVAPDFPHKLYFIACGFIDAHKNHLMLLKVWQAFVARHGANAPKLVIAGSTGPTSRPVIEFLDECKSIHHHVLLSSGLSTPALRQLIRGAKALLMPSIAEGFGLPIVEALAQGTPVIASDIPAHREAGAGGDVTYVEATNAAAWLSCVEAFSYGSEPRSGTRAYKPKTWNDYFKGVEDFLAELTHRPF